MNSRCSSSPPLDLRRKKLVQRPFANSHPVLPLAPHTQIQFLETKFSILSVSKGSADYKKTPLMWEHLPTRSAVPSQIKAIKAK